MTIIQHYDASFDRVFWRGRAIHDLQEAFIALQKSPSPFGGCLSAAIAHFRAGHFDRSARVAQRTLIAVQTKQSFNGHFSQEMSLADHIGEFEALLHR